jgi:hypothetical protein
MTQIGTRKMKVEVDGVDFTDSVSNARFVRADGNTDFLSFAAASGTGGGDYSFQGVAAQDLAAGSLWRKLYDDSGTEVVVTLMPYGNATPSVGEPHVEATVTLAEPTDDLVGGEANTSQSARMTFNFSCACLAKPALVTA